MRPLINILLVVAVLWCGLHLSPAETDETAWLSEKAVAASQAQDELPDNHSQSHAAQSCHSHCPVAPDADMGPALESRNPEAELHFVTLVHPLISAVRAPPIEPPSA